MFRGTTPTHTFSLPFETSLLANLYITYTDKSNVTLLEKDLSNCALNGKNVSVTLTQEETLLFTGRQQARLQLRAITTDGTALASKIYTVYVGETLKEGVIE